MGAFFNVVVDESLNLMKKMSKDDWKKVEETGKDLASNIFSRKKKVEKVQEVPSPVGKQIDVPVNNNSDNEQEYLNEFISCYQSDSEISSGERRLLDKLSKSLGIKVTRAKEIEEKYVSDILNQDSSNNQSLTPEEEEYIEEYKACIEEDDEISDSERRLLNKLSNRSNISKERCKELELMAVGKYYTEDEKEYYDEVYNCYEEDGEVSDNARRLLEKLRKTLNISEERANQIEEIIEDEDY